MQRLLGFVLFSFAVVGCASTAKSDRRIIGFYQQALKRSETGDKSRTVCLDGLDVTDGVLPGCPRFPSFEESGIVVTDPNPSEREAVQLIVAPRVSGSMLDPAELSPEFVKQQSLEQKDALKSHDFTGVYLLPRP
jgi:hypothetical protein